VRGSEYCDISDALFCSGNNVFVAGKETLCLERGFECCRDPVECCLCHRKFPTPKEFLEEYGREVTDDFPVWVRYRKTKLRSKNGSLERVDVEGYEWRLTEYGKAPRRVDCPGYCGEPSVVVCAVTPYGKPGSVVGEYGEVPEVLCMSFVG